MTLFGKNSDRLPNEVHHLLRTPPTTGGLAEHREWMHPGAARLSARAPICLRCLSGIITRKERKEQS
jgi:hypothetical protein